MKKYICILSFCLLATFTNAQTEIKGSPAAWLFTTLSFGVEQVLSEDWGVDIDMFAGEGGFYGTLAGKYYLKPKTRADGFHIGLFTGAGSDIGLGGGFLGGYKLISNKGILFEFGLGIGRGVDITVPYGKLHVGYRFNRKKASKKDMNDI